MAKHIYSVSAYVEREMGTLFLHPFSGRQAGASNVNHQTVPWPINGSITRVEGEIGVAVAGTDTELTAAPLTASIFKNEILEATTTVTITTFGTLFFVTPAITVNVGDRISIRLQQTTPGTTWKGYVNVRFTFQTLFRGTVIGGGTGEQFLSGLAIGFQRIYPSLSDVDIIIDSGIARLHVPEDGEISNFYLYRKPGYGPARFSLAVNGVPELSVIFADGETQLFDDAKVVIHEDDFISVDAEALSGIAKVSWAAYMRST